MTTDRAAFEAWLASTPYPRSPLRNGEGYMFAFNQATWEAWQAATKAERERCAKVCDAERYTGYVPPEDGNARQYYDDAAVNCAAAIRG